MQYAVRGGSFGLLYSADQPPIGETPKEANAMPDGQPNGSSEIRRNKSEDDITAEVLGHRVRLVGMVRGVKSLAAPYLFCSLETGYRLIDFIPRSQTVYVLARCHDPADAPVVAERLRQSGW